MTTAALLVCRPELGADVKVPRDVQMAFMQADPREAVSEEQELWRAFCARMVLDAVGLTGFTGKSLIKKHVVAVRRAQRWWRNNQDDIQMAFDFAGIPLEGVRETMSEFYLDEDDNVVRIAKERQAPQLRVAA